MPRRLPRGRAGNDRAATPGSFRRSTRYSSQIVQSTPVYSALFRFRLVLRENAVPFCILTAFAARAAGASLVRRQRRQRVIRGYIAKRAICIRCCAQDAHLQFESALANHAGERGRMKVPYVPSKYQPGERRKVSRRSRSANRVARSSTPMVPEGLGRRVRRFNNNPAGWHPDWRVQMGAAAKPSQANVACPRILRRCRRCERETPHEVRSVDGMNISVCVRCVERALLYELDRD
jgi:hypothetical protein